MTMCYFFFSSRRRHTRSLRDWSSDVCSSDLALVAGCAAPQPVAPAVVDEQQYTRAMRDGFARYTWPDGRKPDLAVLAEKSGPGPDRAPAGSERIVLEMTNACAWYLGWEDARKSGDQPAVSRAWKVME